MYVIIMWVREKSQIVNELEKKVKKKIKNRKWKKKNENKKIADQWEMGCKQ